MIIDKDDFYLTPANHQMVGNITIYLSIFINWHYNKLVGLCMFCLTSIEQPQIPNP